MSDQESTVAGSENNEPAQGPLGQGTVYDDKKFVKELLEACSDDKEKYYFTDYVVERGRGLEDVHPEKRQRCYVHKEEALQTFVSKTKYRGRKTALHNFLILESMMRGPHALAAFGVGGIGVHDNSV